MQLKLRTIIISAVCVAFSATVWAHGGFDHVMGTVSKYENNVLTVNTGKAVVSVKLDEKTELMKGNAKASLADLKPGVRVVVDIPEGSTDKIAHSVKIGAAQAASTPHGEHEHEQAAHK
jgi:hypothetical protein